MAQEQGAQAAGAGLGVLKAGVAHGLQGNLHREKRCLKHWHEKYVKDKIYYRHVRIKERKRTLDLRGPSKPERGNDVPIVHSGAGARTECTCVPGQGHVPRGRNTAERQKGQRNKNCPDVSH